MRDQLNELMKLASQLRNTIQINNMDDQTIEVSTWITVRRSGKEYYSISFLGDFGSKRLEVNLFQKLDYNSNSVTISLDNVSNDELDEIILRSKEDIIIFIAKLDDTSEQRRLDKIKELENQLKELHNENVQVS
jgi:hypothetical protein